MVLLDDELGACVRCGGWRAPTACGRRKGLRGEPLTTLPPVVGERLPGHEGALGGRVVAGARSSVGGPVLRVGAGTSPYPRTEEEPATVAETFGISEKTGDGVSVVSATGEIDIATAPPLRRQLEASIDRGPAVVVVDLLGVTFMDSTALGVLVGALKRTRAAGGALRIVVSDTRVLKVFEITGLTEVFSIFATVEDAVRG
jgi:anti-sigma B factor antagonist